MNSCITAGGKQLRGRPGEQSVLVKDCRERPRGRPNKQALGSGKNGDSVRSALEGDKGKSKNFRGRRARRRAAAIARRIGAAGSVSGG